jgi:RNA polymerase sigma factor (sigma-70 family)
VPTQLQANRPNKPSITELADGLYANHYPYLLGIAIRNAPTKSDAEEALQDAFVLFITHFKPGSDAPPLAWITLTLKRRCWALYHRQATGIHLAQSLQTYSTQRHYPLFFQGPTPEELIELTELKTQTKKAITQLKPAERVAITYQALGFSYADIRQLTGWTYTKVNRCITEGRAKLRSQHQPNPQHPN